MKIFQIVMWLIGMVLSIVESTSVAQSTGVDSPYVEVFFYDGSRVASDNQLGSASCCPTGSQTCGGVYALGADGGSHITAGPNVLTFDLDNSRYELLYSFGLQQLPDSLLLVGQFYSLQLDAQGNVTGGRKVPLNRTVQYDQPYELHFGTVGEKQLTVQYFVRKNWAAAKRQEIAYGSNTITVKSTCWVSGISTQSGNTQPLVWNPEEKIRLYGSLDAPLRFPADFATAPIGSHDEALSAKVTISFDPPIHRASYPIRTVMQLSRQYTLDTLHTVNQPVDSDVETGSVYRKEIELVKGKVLKLVFPPEGQSLREFKVEDTVVINP